MDRYLRHRYALALPFVALLVVTIVGGAVNGVTARGQVVDDSTSEGVANTELFVGRRTVVADAQGNYVFSNVPRTTSLRVNAQGYQPTSAPPDASEIRLDPFTLTVRASVEGIFPAERIAGAQIREGTRILGTTNDQGQSTLVPYPPREATLLLCAKDFVSKEFKARGVLAELTLVRQVGSDCPPIPTPSPDPNASPSPSPGASPSPSPASSPSPP